MKKVTFVCLLAAITFSCKEKTSETEATEPMVKAATALSLPVSYSTSFKMGNADYVPMVVQGSWKDWQDNTMDNMKSWMADTVVIQGSNNEVVTGVDSVTARWKRERLGYTSLVDSIDAAFPVYSTDKNENWVLIWATEYSTDTKGVKDTTAVMETWRINKDGKADLLLQFNRHKRKK